MASRNNLQKVKRVVTFSKNMADINRESSSDKHIHKKRVNRRLSSRKLRFRIEACWHFIREHWSLATQLDSFFFFSFFSFFFSFSFFSFFFSSSFSLFLPYPPPFPSFPSPSHTDLNCHQQGFGAAGCFQAAPAPTSEKILVTFFTCFELTVYICLKN